MLISVYKGVSSTMKVFNKVA